MPDDETKWRAEFTGVGETQLRDGMNRNSMPFPEPKLQFAFRWLREQDESRRLREVSWTPNMRQLAKVEPCP